MKDEKAVERRERRKQQDEIIRDTLEEVKHKIIILSGKGGVGKSTVAVNLAVALAESGYQTGLMDVDLHGPSVPRLLGLSKYRPGHAGNWIVPMQYTEWLKVVSIESFLEKSDQAIIWRGPMKIGAIRQFISDVAWGTLDYLIIDSPPGTGDEPLTIAQTIPGARAIIVTTPQEISLADVRKSINFCRTVQMPIVGLIENMSGYVCPQCGDHLNIFSTGGGERTAKEMGFTFLGRIPLDPAIVQAGDEGRPNLLNTVSTPAAEAFSSIVTAVTAAFGKAESTDLKLVAKEVKPMEPRGKKAKMKIAVPTSDGRLASHFGHCEYFELFDIKDSQVTGKKQIFPPQHEPGVLPRWLKEQSTDVIIAGGMGSRALGFFTDYGIEVLVGAPALPPDKIVELYLNGSLQLGTNVCDH